MIALQKNMAVRWQNWQNDFKKDVLILHELSIQSYGGSHGIRDIGLPEGAIARPFQTFGGEDLYPTVYDKAAALGESLIINHPFLDGNKRTGILAVAAFLLESGFEINSSEEELYNFTIDISTGKLKFDDIFLWLKNNTQSL